MKQFNNEKAITLIELLVVTAIILILSAIILPSYQIGEKQLALQRSTHKLAQDIRRTQEMAMSAKELPGGGLPDGGYGICFDKLPSPSIFLYADTVPPAERYGTGDQIIETISLEKEVKTKEVRLKKPGNNVSPARVSINFKPPDPEVNLKGGTDEPFDEVEITLSLKTDENQTKTIKVNKVGLIYVAD